jgi:hypothetical protein
MFDNKNRAVEKVTVQSRTMRRMALATFPINPYFHVAVEN